MILKQEFRTNCIERRFWKERQSMTYQSINELYESDTQNYFKIKVHVQWDPSFDQQSKSYVSVWNSNQLKWNHIYSIPYPEMYVVQNKKRLRFYDDTENAESRNMQIFEIDVNHLIDRAIDILFIKQ